MSNMKFLYQPVKPFYINQSFGDNKICIDNDTGKKVISCNGLKPPKGYRSVYSQMKGHNGLDLRAYHGQPVFCSQEGYVDEVVAEDDRGLGIGIVTKDKYHCNETGKKENFKCRYWHLKAILVEKGQYVNVGDLIGLADNTGYSSGDHLHFEIKPVKTGTRKGALYSRYNVLQDNGYFGAVDPLQYMDNIYARDLSTFISKLKTVTDMVMKFVKNYDK